MKTTWNKTVGSVLLSASLILAAVPTLAMADSGGAQGVNVLQSPAAYALTDSIEAGIKSLSINKTAEGTQIGAVVRLHNLTAQMKRVPDYEI